MNLQLCFPKKPSLVLSVQSKHTTKGSGILEYRKTSRLYLKIHFTSLPKVNQV